MGTRGKNDRAGRSQGYRTREKPDALSALQKYDWPGNVRELRNTLEGIIVLSLKDRIEPDDLPEHIRHADVKAAQSVFEPGMSLEDMEREAIRRTLERTGGRRAETAERLGLSVRTLQRKIKQYQLQTGDQDQRPSENAWTAG